MIPPPFQDGQRLNAKELNEFRDELIRLGQITASLPLTVDNDEAGIRFATLEPVSMTIKITGGGTGGKYAWTKQIPATSGGWTNDTVTGSVADDPAVEANGTTTIPPSTIILRAYRDRVTGVLSFERSTC